MQAGETITSLNVTIDTLKDEVKEARPSCPICLQSFTADSIIPMRMACNHVVCSACIPNISNGKCPKCRADIVVSGRIIF